MKKPIQFRISFDADDEFATHISGMNPGQIRREIYYLIRRGLESLPKKGEPAGLSIPPAAMSTLESASTTQGRKPSNSATRRTKPPLDLALLND